MKGRLLQAGDGTIREPPKRQVVWTAAPPAPGLSGLQVLSHTAPAADDSGRGVLRSPIEGRPKRRRTSSGVRPDAHWDQSLKPFAMRPNSSIESLKGQALKRRSTSGELRSPSMAVGPAGGGNATRDRPVEQAARALKE
jgi:hypothetical protein